MPTRKGSRTTSGTGPWEIDAPFSAFMREAGAVLVGKTTTPEFGWKGVTDNPLYGITRNPWDTRLTAGGSSGGAAAAAALNLGVLHQAAMPVVRFASLAPSPAPSASNRPSAMCRNGRPAP